MSLIDGLILHTFNQVNEVSQYSMLMRFYELDKLIDHEYSTKTYKECFHNLNLYFMEIEARTILKALKLI